MRLDHALVVDLGASHAEAHARYRKNEGWHAVTWPRGNGPENLGRVDSIPTITAVPAAPQTAPAPATSFVHGHQALRAVEADADRWRTFSCLKLALVKDSSPDEALALAEERAQAKALGQDLETIALSFFQHVLTVAVDGLHSYPHVLINIIDSWSNETAQRLVDHLRSILPNAIVDAVDECFCSVLGVTHDERFQREEHLVVVDGGHSTMSVGYAQSNSTTGIPEVVHYGTWPLGAGLINAGITTACDGELDKSRLFEVLSFVDEHVKPAGDKWSPPPKYGIDRQLWDRLMSAGEARNNALDRDRVDVIQKELTALPLQPKNGSRELRSQPSSVALVITGRALRSVSFRQRLNSLSDIAAGNVQVYYDDEANGRTRVVQGLQCIADSPSLLNLERVQLSLWIRSDLDGKRRPGKHHHVIRIAKAGQALEPDHAHRRDERSLREPVLFELTHFPDRNGTDGRVFEFDLSLYATPKTSVDRDVICEEGDAERYTSSTSDKLDCIGSVRRKLCGLPNDSVPAKVSVYVYILIKRFTIRLFAVYAEDGRDIPTLERANYKGVVADDNSLSDQWTAYSPAIHLLHVGQICRLERVNQWTVDSFMDSFTSDA